MKTRKLVTPYKYHGSTLTYSNIRQLTGINKSHGDFYKARAISSSLLRELLIIKFLQRHVVIYIYIYICTWS